MKAYVFSLGKVDIDIFFAPIREKKHVIALLMKAIKLMKLPRVSDADKAGEMILKVSDMSRLFFFSENKYFSISFPFTVKEDGANFIFSSKYIEDIGSRETSDILSFLECDGIVNSICIFDFMEPIEELARHSKYIWSLFKELILMESGYLRHDYDPKHQNGKMHPLNHLDIFYSSKATFKIGTEDRFTKENFIDLLDLTTTSYYLKY